MFAVAGLKKLLGHSAAAPHSEAIRGAVLANRSCAWLQNALYVHVSGVELLCFKMSRSFGGCPCSGHFRRIGVRVGRGFARWR
jgi:hypothetical protein